MGFLHLPIWKLNFHIGVLLVRVSLRYYPTDVTPQEGSYHIGVVITLGPPASALTKGANRGQAEARAG